jgi:serpin B
MAGAADEDQSTLAMLTRTLTFAVPLLLVMTGCSPRDPRTVTSSTTGITSVVDSNNDFAWKLYGAASPQSGNLFFSPFSISSAFGMTLAGAGGDTATEMRNVFSIQGDEATYHRTLGALLRDLGGDHQGRGYELHTADRLFGQKGTPFTPAFLSLVGTQYGAPLDAVDFASNPSSAISQINSWASLETNGKVPAIVDNSLVSQDTRLVVSNAIYFKAAWATGFNPAKTRQEAFHVSSTQDVTVPMMHRSGKGLSVFGDTDVSLLDMNYQDDELSMVILMPQDKAGLPALEQKLNRTYVDGLIAKEQPFEVDDLALPRWQVGEELPLKDLLQGLGMVKAFDPAQADFSRMLDPTQGKLSLNFAVHKAYVSVDEQGTEAAAVTATGAVATAFVAYAVDHPFVYLIRDRLTGSILFMGRMVDPTDHGSL